MRPTLVALDLDGTLLDEGSRLPPGHARAVRELVALGAQVAIVTGRPLLTTTWVWRELGLPTPAVCFNGTWVGVPGQTPLAAKALAQADARTAIAALRDFDGAICGYPDCDTWIMDREIAHTRRWREFYRVDIPVAPERFSAWSGPTWKLMFVADPAAMAGIEPRLRARLGGAFHVVLSQNDRIEILPSGVSKDWGLRHLAASLGVARDDVWAVGDADNDREMIAWAGHGCAMGQAPERITAIARHRLPSIEARGLCALPPLIARHLGR
jgi:Cof subfamily protein (haloacid dehalogenase superfamily)